MGRDRARPCMYAPGMSRASTGGPFPTPEASGGRRSEGDAAVLWGHDEDTRLLLRGLLRLHHFRVVDEVSTAEEVRRRPPAPVPELLVYDAETVHSAWWDEISAVLRDRPDLRTVVILPRGVSAELGRTRLPAAKAVLARPFAIRDLVVALQTAAGRTDPPTASSGS